VSHEPSPARVLIATRLWDTLMQLDRAKIWLRRKRDRLRRMDELSGQYGITTREVNV